MGNNIESLGWEATETRYGYDMVYVPARAEHPAVRGFRNSMNEEAKLCRDQIAEALAQYDANLGKRIREKDGPDN